MDKLVIPSLNTPAATPTYTRWTFKQKVCILKNVHHSRHYIPTSAQKSIEVFQTERCLSILSDLNSKCNEVAGGYNVKPALFPNNQLIVDPQCLYEADMQITAVSRAHSGI